MEQTPERIVRWAERQEERKPQGRAGHLTSEQRQQIRLAYFEAGGNTTNIALGRQFNVNRETVSTCLKGPEFEALRKQFDAEIKASAVERLKAGVLPAADAWVKAVDIAGDRGDHKPAKDLLMHTGVIEPLDEDGRAREGITPAAGNSFARTARSLRLRDAAGRRSRMSARSPRTSAINSRNRSSVVATGGTDERGTAASAMSVSEPLNKVLVPPREPVAGWAFPRECERLKVVHRRLFDEPIAMHLPRDIRRGIALRYRDPPFQPSIAVFANHEPVD